jgi:hypothetical protein
MSNLDKELKAYQSMADLLTQAKAVRWNFEDANVGIPPALSRLLGESANGHDGESPKIIVSPPKTPRPPGVATDNWVWFDPRDATLTTLALAILRTSESPMLANDLFHEIRNFHKDANSGSFANIGARLDGTIIKRSEEGWTLVDPTNAPVLFDGYIWGEPSVFKNTELAGHRRALICHMLQAWPGGLQIVQLVHHLRSSGLCRAPVSKDLVKVDMETLEKEGQARRIGNSRKWVVGRKKEGK